MAAGGSKCAIPIIDLFAGPGGLGEGFTSIRDSLNHRLFRIGVSIEKDEFAHQTLQLRALYRQFRFGLVPSEYYSYLQGDSGMSRERLFESLSKQAEAASEEAWNATLGEVPVDVVDKRIETALAGSDTWVLIGGPPRQAYSLAGRSRVGGINPADPRVYLYREYLRILARHAPPVFVMENVKGLLSSRVDGEGIFELIRRDLQQPAKAVRRLRGSSAITKDHGYRLYSLVCRPLDAGLSDNPENFHASDFVIRCEDYGIPQARHRVILLGIRDDYISHGPGPLVRGQTVTIEQTISGLPHLRSGLSKMEDSAQEWQRQLGRFLKRVSLRDLPGEVGKPVTERVCDASNRMEAKTNPVDERGDQANPRYP